MVLSPPLSCFWRALIKSGKFLTHTKQQVNIADEHSTAQHITSHFGDEASISFNLTFNLVARVFTTDCR